MKSKDIKYIVSAHNEFWEQQRLEMKAYANTYRKKMFSNSQASQLTTGNSDVVVETADGYAIIEAYVSALFPKAPGVIIAPDATGTGNAPVAEAIANRFLFDKFALIEQGLRFSLIYPFAAWKMGVVPKKKIIDSVDIKPVYPWDIITDQNATRWENQRFVGHRYYLPLSEAKERFGNKEWVGAERTDYLDSTRVPAQSKSYVPNDSYKLSTLATKKSETGSTLLTYVEIIEMYDFQNDELTFYSPTLKTGEGIIDIVSPIPFKDEEGISISPLVPIYLGQDPAVPLRGYSTMGRLYSQLYEINSIRTFYARAVRKDTRIYLARKGVLDEEAKANISNNIDNSIVEIDAPMDTPVSTIVSPLINQGLSGDFYNYSAQVKVDLDRGNLLGAMGRGAPTGGTTPITATEAASIQLSLSSEAGKLARFRDQAIEQIAKLYIMLVKILLDTKPDGEDPEVIIVDEEKVIITPKDLEGSFRVVSQDAGTTPLSSAIKKQRLLEMSGLLINLGLDRTALLETLIKEFELPASLAEAIVPPQPPQMPPQGVGEVPGGPSPANPPEGIAETIRGATGLL
jgi:hypothetical protein